MAKLANPEHEAWFQSVSAALDVTEQADAGAAEEYAQSLKNHGGQFKRALEHDADKSLAKQIRQADVKAKAGEFVAAVQCLEVAGQMALTLIQSAGKPAPAGPSKTESGEKPLVGKAKKPQYEGEDKELGWRKEAWKSSDAKDSDRVVTKYDRTEEERKASAKDVAEDGRMVAHRDRDKDGKPLDGGEEQPLKDGSHGYVIDPKTGQMHTFDQELAEYRFKDGHVAKVNIGDPAALKKLEQKHGPFVQTKRPHHTTPLAGADVAGAGDLEVADSRIKVVSDQSGHYKPGEEHMLQTIELLSKQGALVDDRTPLESTLELQTKMKESIRKFQEAGIPEKQYATLVQQLKYVEEVLESIKGRKDRNAPMHREAKVRLVGKVGISEEEYKQVNGDFEKVYSMIEKKALKELSIDLEDDAPLQTQVRNSLAENITNLTALNLFLGKHFSLYLSQSQYLQSAGNEQQARRKKRLNEDIEETGRDAANQRKDKHVEKLEVEIERLGGDDAITKLGLDPAHLKPQEKFDILSGALPAHHVKPKHDKRKALAESRKAILSNPDIYEPADASEEREMDEAAEADEMDGLPAPPKEAAEPLSEAKVAEMTLEYEEYGGDQEVMNKLVMAKGMVDWAEPVIRHKVSLADKLDLLTDRVSVDDFFNALPDP
jgi:hypothetical protein